MVAVHLRLRQLLLVRNLRVELVPDVLNGRHKVLWHKPPPNGVYGCGYENNLVINVQIDQFDLLHRR
jgi:hypothetical protein